MIFEISMDRTLLLYTYLSFFAFAKALKKAHTSKLSTLFLGCYIMRKDSYT